MSKKRTRVLEMESNVILIVQLFFTALAFLAMVVLSYTFMSRDVRENLVRNAESTLDFIESQTMYDLLGSKIMLNDFAQTIRNMIQQHYVNADELQTYTMNMCRYMYLNEGGKSLHSGLYGYIENCFGKPVVLKGSNEILPDNFSPTDCPWYQAALAAGDSVAETLSYGDETIDDIILTYSLCIYDDKGGLLGVVCVDVKMNYIGNKIVNTAMEKETHGMLISQDLTFIVHPNPEFIKKKMSDPIIPLSKFKDDMINKEKISEEKIITWKGENAIVFFRKLPNGWYIGTLTPKASYYYNISKMALLLGLLGFGFASVLITILISTNAAKNKSDIENKHKSTFLSNMSHELRTPLNAVIGMTAIGKTSADIERKDYCFLKIENASKHLLSVINDILDMSKIEANKFELSPVEFSFEKMLQHISDFINFKVSEKQQEFTVRIDKSIPQNLIGDDQRIAQVITNLLSNAVKFTPEKGLIRLDTRFLGEEDDICTIQIQVSDTGVGINPETQKILFQPFQQAEAHTKRKFGGTGLGLSISKNIVELMGGKIWVKSEPGKGSTFSFLIKLKRGEKDSFENNLRGVNWNNVKILAVDDDPGVLMYFQEILQNFGIGCDIAASGSEALEITKKKGAYNFYFVDWRMPEIDGIKLTEKLREGGYVSRGKTIVIMISSAELGVIEKVAKKAGVNKFLTKPLFPSAIMNILNEFLEIERNTGGELSKYNGIFTGYSILLAEDMKVNCEILLALFEPTLLKIDCAENGLEAVEMFAESSDKYDLIFMDLQMPEMDGYEATKRIRAMKNIDKAKSIPIIAMTANVFKEDIEKCIAIGMNDHVGKPIDFDDVLEKMKKYLPKKRRRPPLDKVDDPA
ncbi:MAG: response regulator [Chitinispirillales bacterium]|jgi:signal transduction histidine kinase/CheY-like chemotaxis protein|nr:response regulator [Chitinispirillales bacterium]